MRGFAGGIVGTCSGASISNCSNIGTVTSSTYFAGGIIGRGITSPAVKNCLNAGSVSAARAGAIASQGSFVLTNCFYDKEASKPVTVAAYGKSDAYGVAQAVSTAALKTWGAAYQLNGGAAGGSQNGNVAGMTAWRQATGRRSRRHAGKQGLPGAHRFQPNRC